MRTLINLSGGFLIGVMANHLANSGWPYWPVMIDDILLVVWWVVIATPAITRMLGERP
jgi:hypothetical protein